METQVRTDDRLVNILEGGQMMLVAKDPQRLLQGATVTGLAIDYATNAWRLSLVFPNGATLSLQGTIGKGEFIIQKALLPPVGTKKEEYIMPNPSKTLVKALGDLSRVPVRLKQYLSREAKISGKTGLSESVSTKFLADAKDALFYKVEGAEEKTKKDLFKNLKINYILSEQGETVKSEIVARYRTENSVINITVETDIYGIGNKKVTLTKKLGAGRYAVIDCRRKDKEKDIPSLVVAFDLDKAIKELYPPQQRPERKQIEKPKYKK